MLELLESRRLFAANLLIDAAGFSAANSVTVDGTSYFFADNGPTGRELWKSDGSIAGTTLVKDLTPGAAPSELVSMHQANGKAVFLTVVHHGVVNHQLKDDYTLWSSDGTAEGTVPLMQFNSVVYLVTAQVGDQVAIVLAKQSPLNQGGDTSDDSYLYFTNGTSAGTRLVKSHIAQMEGGYLTTHLAMKVFTAGNHVVYTTQNDDLWSSDGVTTTDLRPIFGSGTASTYKVALDKIVQLDGKVLIPSQDGYGKFWVSDGTTGGTIVHNVNVTGRLEPIGDSDTVIGNKYIFTEVEPGTIVKRVKVLDLDDDSITTLYTTAGDGSAQHVTTYKLPGHILFQVVNLEALTNDVYSTDGTVAGTTKLVSFTNFTQVYAPSIIGDTGYFVIARAPYVVDSEESEGWVGSGTSMTKANVPGTASLELWRTDGSAANTGKVKDIWVGDPAGLVVTADLTVADGKLLVHELIRSGTVGNGYPLNPGVVLGAVFEDTSAYDPKELTFGRQGASVRLVNGVLKVNGSTGNDRIRMWRSQRMPEKLIVEYNGNERSFIFNDITKIVADLQDGNDYFRILEGEGQIIRTRTSILGGDGADTIYGGTGRDTIFGGNSGDLIYGRGNADVILAGGGRDRVNAGAGEDQISGGSGIDSIVGGVGIDVFFGQNAVEKAFGEDVEGTETDDDVFLG